MAIKKGSHPKTRASTFIKKEKYLNEIRVLMFLTDTNFEDAIERVFNFHTPEPDDEQQEYEGPTEYTLRHWWTHRSERYKEKLTVNDLIYDSYELAVEETCYIRSNKSGKGQLEIKKEVKEAFDKMAPRTDGSDINKLFSILAYNHRFHVLLDLLDDLFMETNYLRSRSLFKKLFPNF